MTTIKSHHSVQLKTRPLYVTAQPSSLPAADVIHLNLALHREYLVRENNIIQKSISSSFQLMQTAEREYFKLVSTYFNGSKLYRIEVQHLANDN